MKTMAEVLTGKTFAGRQLNERQIAEVADALTAAGYGPVKAVLALADEWESKYGPGTRKEEVFGPQKVSIKFAVKSIRMAIENALNP